MASKTVSRVGEYSIWLKKIRKERKLSMHVNVQRKLNLFFLFKENYRPTFSLINSHIHKNYSNLSWPITKKKKKKKEKDAWKYGTGVFQILFPFSTDGTCLLSCVIISTAQKFWPCGYCYVNRTVYLSVFHEHHRFAQGPHA